MHSFRVAAQGAMRRLLGRDTEPARAPGFHGPIASWDEAVRASDGWDASIITVRTLAAMRLLRDGQVAGERDSLTFDKPRHSEIVLAGLCAALARGSDLFRVIDFGGSLGTHFFQCHRLLQPLLDARRLEWLVVERPVLVDLGRQEFARDGLKFFASFDEAAASGGDVAPADLVMFTGSLQYLRDPLEVLRSVAETRAPLLALDRVRTSSGKTHGVYVQQPSDQTHYAASYPCWVFGKELLIREIEALGFDLLHDAPRSAGAPFDSCGLLFARRRR